MRIPANLIWCPTCDGRGEVRTCTGSRICPTCGGVAKPAHRQSAATTRLLEILREVRDYLDEPTMVEWVRDRVDEMIEIVERQA